jgi:hypothetical protein
MGSMAGPGRTASGVSTLGEDAQPSEEAGETLEWQGPLEWQSELDVAIAEIDSRLSHPRRRATDIQPTLPSLGQPEITSEMIDEIAWRVSELLRGGGGEPAKATAVAAAISRSMTTAQAPPALRPPAPLPEEPEELPQGIALTIRIRRPFFRLPWPFRRRRRQSMITFSDYRVT